MRFVVVFLCYAGLAACSSDEPAEQQAPEQQAAAPSMTSSTVADTLPNGEPKRIEVQHILISFSGTGTQATRSQGDAQLLAIEVLSKAQNGEDFNALMQTYSDDPGPGVYALRNDGVAPHSDHPQEYERRGMVPAFGDVGFTLQVGEIKIANYSKTASPYGWHIIKRLK